LIEIKYQSLSKIPDKPIKVVPISKNSEKRKTVKFNISQLLLFNTRILETYYYPLEKPTPIILLMPSKAMIAKRVRILNPREKPITKIQAF